MEQRLAARQWLEDDFTIADIAMVTVLRALEDDPLLAAYPALEAYVARGKARPAFGRAIADQIAKFAAHAPPAQGD